MMRGVAGLEYLEVRAGSRPASIFNPRRKNNRCIVPRSLLNLGIESSAASDHNVRTAGFFNTIETDRITVVHREANQRATRSKLRIDDPWERLGVIYIASRKVENDLLCRNGSHERREIHVEVSDRTSKRVDIRKSKYLRRQSCCE